jgi:hypothetical protein
MKTKLAIVMGVMTAALFLLVPSASPKHGSGGGGGGASVTVSATCLANDSCGVSATGLSATSQYRLEVVDSGTGCTAGPVGVIASGDFPGSALTLPNQVTFPLNDAGCDAGGTTHTTFTFNLYLLARKGSFGGGTLVGSVTVADE